MNPQKNSQMNIKPISEAKSPDLRNAGAALIRAAQAARAAAIQHKTPLIIQQNGQMVKLIVH
jgi:hypothetical protein